MTASKSSPAEGYERALDLLRRALTPHGFLASIVDIDNYRRIWSRDGVIAGLAGLASEESDLVEGMRRTLVTLADHQGPHGEIPSNVLPESDEVSYGTLVGRVDAPLWFLLGLGRYLKATGDKAFASLMRPAAERVVFLLGCWEMNNRGLIYVPLGGDWADEYPLAGYNLYVQVLYYRSLREFADAYADDETAQRADGLKRTVEEHFLPAGDGPSARTEAFGSRIAGTAPRDEFDPEVGFYRASFSPAGYQAVFDGFGNSLALLSGVGPLDVREQIIDGIEGLLDRLPLRLLPAFYPPIHEGDPQWSALTHCYRFRFRNNPFEYHNGGLWPMVTGFYAAALVHHNHRAAARRCLDAINSANQLDRSGDGWEFAEYLNGESGEPRGTAKQTWSAAGAVLSARALATGGSPV